MKRLLWSVLILSICSLPAVTLAAPLLEENFSYTPVTLLTANGWTSHSGTNNFIPVTTGGLTYAGYASSNIGNAASLVTSGQDVNRSFTSQTTGSVYCSFLVQVSAAQATGDYFIHLVQTPGATASGFYGRVFCRSSGSGVNFGISKAGTTAVTINYLPTVYSLNTTYLIIVKYTFVAGLTNDTVDMWVNPAVGGSEPLPQVSAPDVAGTDGTAIAAVALRQGTAANAPTLWGDGIRCGLTWEDVDAASTGACCNITTGACSVTTQVLCDGNIYKGDATTCSPDPCMGACCAPDGSCSVTTAANCVGFSVWHPEWLNCGVAACQPLAAACCHINGTCTLETTAGCAAISGTFMGYGNNCSMVNCQAQLGACCGADGSCTVTSIDGCVGIWHIDWLNCDPLPNGLCPPPLGACCSPSTGGCTDLTAADCATAGGNWVPYPATCAITTCPAPVGACCAPVSGACTVTSQLGCVGTWIGYPSTCSPDPCPKPGACCMPNGDCTVIQELACQQGGGVWKGAGILCVPYPCPPIQMTICQARQNDSVGFPIHNGQTVVVDGVATVAFGTYGPSFAITSDGCCIYVYGSYTGSPVIAIGDQVHVTGSISSFYGATEMGTPNLSYSVTSSGNPVPAPAVLTTGELAANGENYESCIVRLNCVHIVSGTWPAAGALNTSIYVDDGSGQVQVYIYAITNIPGSPQPVGNFDIVGMVFQHDSTSPYDCCYQLEPRSTDDLFWGACCQHNGTCTLKCPAECEAVGGIFHNEWKACIPNPCPMPTGACCSPLGGCLVTTLAECASPNTWLGMDTVCIPDNPCQQPSGACCHPDGTCLPVLEPQCVQPNVWQGPDTVCEPTNPCPQAPGACCSPAGACDLRLLVDCSLPNTWLGPLTTCVPNNFCPQPTGACCTPSGGCSVTLEGECQTPSIWHPEWASCAVASCPIPMGACCEASGICNYLPQAQCFPPRVWLAGLPCTPDNPCQQPTGACCTPLDGSCVVTTQTGCVLPSIWHPEWPTCTPNNPCPQPAPLRACCAPLGACTITEAGECLSPSIWHSDWLACEPTNPCPIPPAEGACCAPAGTCTITIATACVSPSIWHSEWTSCTPNHCPLPVVGACCLNGACTISTSAACAATSGTYKGDGTICTPNPCGPPPVPVERSTWGQIKNKYR